MIPRLFKVYMFTLAIWQIFCPFTFSQNQSEDTPQRQEARSICINVIANYSRNEDLEKAYNGLLEALKVDPTYSILWFNLGILAESAEKWTEAKQHFEKFLKLDNKSENAILARVKLARLKKIIEQSQTEQGKRNIQYEIAIANAKAYFKKNELGKAFAQAAAATKIDDKRFEAYCIAALILMKQNAFDEACIFLQQAAERSSKRQKQLLQKSLEQCEQEKKSQGHLIAANNAMELSEYRRAAKEFLAALTIFPDRDHIAFSAALAWGLAGEYIQSVKILNQLLISSDTEVVQKAREKIAKLEPILIPILQKIESEATAHFANQEFNKAINKWEEVIILVPNRHEIYYNIACAYSLQGKKEEAISWLRKAVSKGLRDANLMATDNKLDPIRSEKNFQNFLEGAFPEEILNTSNERMNRFYKKILEEGIEFLASSRFDEATKIFEHVISCLPDQGDAYFYMACKYSLAKETSKALDWLRQAKAKGFQNTPLLHNCVFLDPIRFEHQFRHFLENEFGTDIATASAERCYNQLISQGLPLLQQNRMNEAVLIFEKAIDIFTNRPEPYYNIVCAYASQGRKDEVLTWLNKAFDNGFKNDNLVITDDRIDSFRTEKSLRDLLKIKRGAGVANASDERIYLKLLDQGINSLSSNNFSQSIEFLEKATQVFSDKAEVYYYLASAYCMKGQKNESLYNLEQAVDKGFHNIKDILQNRYLDGIRREVKYRQIMAKAIARLKKN
ncbi:MAG: tetratricopeptide repeat protein [Candidatus Brocadiae bacterium]|nr:tetratricopeptide repeat protein [Candidatus Brocadiia bacterium]